MSGAAIVLVYVTLPNRKAASRLSRLLLSRQLVACTNVFPNMESHYVWKGKSEHSREVVLIAKTTQTKRPALERFITAHHPYECPCIISIKADRVNRAYRRWVEQSVAKRP